MGLRKSPGKPREIQTGCPACSFTALGDSTGHHFLGVQNLCGKSVDPIFLIYLDIRLN
ncbi:MAG: hypothetical protein CM15mP125_0430 [Gammaproteobacteria bacterium]|nr:MAG: hypothetical protein CM15mP125_0430 [Gammaproteobacteria bacterium]